jgi:hypothetical protein
MRSKHEISAPTLVHGRRFIILSIKICCRCYAQVVGRKFVDSKTIRPLRRHHQVSIRSDGGGGTYILCQKISRSIGIYISSPFANLSGTKQVGPRTFENIHIPTLISQRLARSSTTHSHQHTSYFLIPTLSLLPLSVSLHTPLNNGYDTHI